MPTRYPQKNSIEQIFLEHLQRAERTDRQRTGMLPSRIQETHNPVWETDRQIYNDKTLLSWNQDVREGEKEGTEEEGIDSVGEGEQGKQRKANMQSLTIWSGTFWVLAHEHSGNPFLFLGLSLVGSPSILHSLRQHPQWPPTVKGHRGSREHISSVLNLAHELWKQADLNLTLTQVRCLGARISGVTSPARFLMAKMRMTSSTLAKP